METRRTMQNLIPKTNLRDIERREKHNAEPKKESSL